MEHDDSTARASLQAAASPAVPEQPDLYDFATSLPLRLDVAAALAYVGGPLGSTVLLLGEHQNDLVRFHAWQSLLLGLVQMLLLIGARLIATRCFYLLLGGMGLCNLVWARRAYQQSAVLRVFYLPLVGQLARHLVLTE